MGNGVVGVFGAVFLVAVLAGAGARARADGALAVGSTGDVVRDGIAFGMVVNESKDTAAETAVTRCRTFKARAAAERCKVVATFSGQCFAVAYDPQPGTPGAGWGIGPDQLAANRKAIAMCEETAGAGRKGYCRVESGACDGSAQVNTDPSGATEPATAQGPDLERQQWTDLRSRLGREQQSWLHWDVPVLLLLAGAVGWAAYVFSRPLRSKRKGEPSVGKSSKAKAKRNPQ